MAGYSDTKQKIIDSLMNREVGTQIQPENHQDFALSLLEYIRSVELVSGSTLIGIATRTTVPVQSDESFECYISSCGKGQSITFENFHGFDGNALTCTSEGDSAYFILLTWNKQYWEMTQIETSVSTLEIFQATGQSETVTMSQKAITDNLNKKPTIADGDGTEGDLDFSDDAGNVIARFKEGHIQTKEFNSKTTLSKLKSLDDDHEHLKYGLMYYTCETDGNTLVKHVDGLSDGHLQGVSQKVKMLHAHTATSGTVRYEFGSIAHGMLYNGKKVTPTNTWADNEIIEVWCDGRTAYSKPWYGGSIDATLEVEHAAADAKATGDRIKALEENDVNDKLVWGSGTDPDLIIKDKDGNQIAEFNDGEIKTPYFDSRKRTQTEDDENADLDIGDENGNAVVRFKDGHVKVKNFDSSVDASEEHRGLMSAEDKAKLNGIEEGAQVNETNVTSGEDADLDISDQSGNAVVRFKDGHIKTQKFDSSVNGQTAVTTGEDADLDIADEEGNAIARFSGGGIQTKNFDSAATPKQIDDDSTAELQIADESGNAIVEFSGGNIRTKNFDSRIVPSQDGDDESGDLDITDPAGNVIAQFKDGHFKTKNFDSRNSSGAEVIKTAEGKNILVLSKGVVIDHKLYL